MRSIFKHAVVRALRWQAGAVLRKYRPKIIAVTGSVGKTSTKDAIFAALAPGAYVRKSQKSQNSEIGIPLTILGAANAWNNPLRWLMNIIDGFFLIWFNAQYPEWLVLEVGADRPGDISSLKRWLKVDVAVITRLPEVPVHVEFFDSPEAVIEEKASLIDCLVPGGALVLFGDDERTRALERRLPAPDAKILTFGFSAECDVRGEEPAAVREDLESWPVGMAATIHSGKESARLEIRGVLGAHAFLPALGTAAVAAALGKTLHEAVGGLRSYVPPPGRMRLTPGIKKTLIIDDTYNASPAAVEAALEALSLARMPGGRAVAVLGDMAELGRRSIEEHRKAGALAAKTCDVLVTVGFRARDIAAAALEGGVDENLIMQFEDSRHAGKELESVIQERDVVLVKGSQSMRMERAVEEIMAQPERAGELLVRQEPEWKRR